MKNIALILLFISVNTHVQAIALTPTILEFNIDGSQSAQIVVTNSSTDKLALEANIYKLSFLESGLLKDRQLDSESLMVFPLAALLKPGEKQLFRLQWTANRNLIQSESYFVRFSQINFSGPKQTNNSLQPNIKFQLHYNAVVHVYTESHRPNVSMTVAPDGAVVVENTGSRFSYTSLLRFHPTSEVGEMTWSSLIGEHFIPPNSRLELSTSHPLPSGEYDGRTP